MKKGIVVLRTEEVFKHEIFMKIEAIKRIGRRNDVKIYIVNPKEGLNFERLSTALNLILSEKDVLHYLNEHQKGSPLS